MKYYLLRRKMCWLYGHNWRTFRHPEYVVRTCRVCLKDDLSDWVRYVQQLASRETRP